MVSPYVTDIDDPNVNITDGLDYSPNMETVEMQALVNEIKDVSNELKIDLIYLNEIIKDGATATETISGFTIADFLAESPDWVDDHKRTCFMSQGVLLKPFLTAHEMGHALTNHAHYIADYNPEGDDPTLRFRNLMLIDGTSGFNSPVETKRLWAFQVDWVRGVTNIPQ